MPDTQGFEEFYTAAVGRLLGQLFPVTGDLHEAEEVVQEAFARASIRWSRIRDYDVPEAWVRRVAMNLAADRGRRGRQRRRRIAGAAAVGLAVALAVGTGALGRLAGQPDLPAITPPTSLSPLIDLDLRGDVHAPAAETAISTLSSEVGRCPGGLGAEGTLVGYFRSAELRRLVVIGAKRPASGETTVCWAVGVFELDGSGTLSPPVKPSPIATPLTANVQRSTGYGALYGQVDPRAVRVLVRFRERPSLEVRVIQAEFQFQVNLYVALFQPGAVPVEVTALDAAGRRLGGCALATAADLPRCPEH